LAGKPADDAIKAVCRRNGLVMLYLLQGVTEFADFKPKPGDELDMVATFLPMQPSMAIYARG
jgi:hypothetical protein